MENIEIKVAGLEHQENVLVTAQLAFAADPFFRWLMPDPVIYLNSYAKVIMAMAGKSFENESAFYSENFSAVSLWLPPGVNAEDDLVGTTLLEIMPEQLQESLVLLGEEIGKYHPDNCWYLVVLGVDVIKQGQGLGAAMLKQTLKQCDEQGVPAYLESSNPNNISLYQRHGFEVMGEIFVGNPQALTPMIRQPQ